MPGTLVKPDPRVLPVVAGTRRAEHRCMDTTIDVTALKEIQKFIWSQGDFSRIATAATPAAAGLVQAVGTRAGDRVLDVAAGTAARRSPPRSSARSSRRRTSRRGWSN